MSVRILIAAALLVAIGIAVAVLFRADPASAPIPISNPPPSAPTPQRRAEPILPQPESAPEPAESRAELPPETRPESRPPFTFQGRTPDEILAEFKDVADTTDNWSVGQMNPFQFGLFNLYSFAASEKPLVIKYYLEGFREHYLSPAAITEDPDRRPDLAAWPAHEAWMKDALDLLIRVDNKWYTVSRQVNDERWRSSHSKDELSAVEVQNYRLAGLKREVEKEIERHESALWPKRSESAPAGGR